MLLQAPDDALVLEDEKARMVLRGDSEDALPLASLVTGARAAERPVDQTPSHATDMGRSSSWSSSTRDPHSANMASGQSFPNRACCQHTPYLATASPAFLPRSGL